MIDKVYVIDDLIPKNYQELIKETIFDTYNQQWFLKRSLSESTEDPYPNEIFSDAPGFVNVFFNKNGITNPILYNRVMPMLHLAVEKINFKFNELLFGRTFLQLPLSTHTGMTNPHIDLRENHLVCIYYTIDSDGETVLLNKINDPLDSPRPEFTEGSFEILHKIEPKQGRALLFDGRIYHTNILPQKNIRNIINFNVI